MFVQNYLKEFNNLTNKIEEKYSLDMLCVCDDKIWPLVKISLFELISRHKERTLTERVKEKYLDYSIKEDINENLDQKKFDTNVYNDILFLTDDHFYIQIHDYYVNKYLDPIIEELAKNFVTQKIHLNSKISKYKKIESYKVASEPHTGNIKLSSEALDIINNVVSDFNNSYFEKVDLTHLEKMIINKSLDVQEGKSFINNLGDKPKMIFYSSYSLPFKLGLNIQSKKFNIKTIDVQHGKQGPNNPLYSNWGNVTEITHYMLPDYFWTWNMLSKDRIENVGVKKTGLQAVVSGYKFAQTYTKKENKTKNILITLQPLSFKNTFYIQSFLMNYIKKDKNFNWIVKPHPRQTMRDLVKIKKLFNYPHVTITSNDNIFELLNNSALHITEYSSTAYEGLYLNVETIFTNPIAKDEYFEELKEGKFYYCDNLHKLQKTIDKLMNIEINKVNVLTQNDYKYTDLIPVKNLK